MSTLPLRRILELAVGPQNVDAAGHAMADWLEVRLLLQTAAMIRHELSTGRPAELGQDVPHDRPDTSVRTELMAKLATQREVLLSLCERVDRLEMRADGLTPIERVERRWAKERSVKESLTVGGDGPAVQSREPASVVEQPSDELVAKWIAEVWHEGTPVRVAASDLHLASRAAEWGARWGHHSPDATKMASQLAPQANKNTPASPVSTEMNRD